MKMFILRIASDNKKQIKQSDEWIIQKMAEAAINHLSVFRIYK